MRFSPSRVVVWQESQGGHDCSRHRRRVTWCFAGAGSRGASAIAPVTRRRRAGQEGQIIDSIGSPPRAGFPNSQTGPGYALLKYGIQALDSESPSPRFCFPGSSPPTLVAISRFACSWPGVSLQPCWAPWWAYGGHEQRGQKHKPLTSLFMMGVTRFELVVSYVSAVVAIYNYPPYAKQGL